MAALLALLGILLLSVGLADLLGRWMGWGALAWGSRASEEIALTFDDGPGPQLEKLLEVLSRYGIKATFFLTGQRASPEQIARLQAEGHQVEAHGYWHRPALLMSPWGEWLQIARSPGRLYRPPWGIHSPWTRLFCRLQGKKVALWDTESRDWLEEPLAEQVERILVRIRPGSILLLHDGPARTVALLEALLPRLLALGYRPVRLDQMALRPLRFHEGVQRAFQGWEERYDRRHRVMRAGLRPFHLLRLEAKPLPMALPGFPKGTPAMELHLESARIAELPTLKALRAFRESLSEAARLVAERPEVELVFGSSHLGSAAVALGFRRHPLPPLARLGSRLAEAWFVWLYRGRLTRGVLREHPEILYMERAQLLRYLEARPPRLRSPGA